MSSNTKFEDVIALPKRGRPKGAKDKKPRKNKHRFEPPKPKKRGRPKGAKDKNPRRKRALLSNLATSAKTQARPEAIIGLRMSDAERELAGYSPVFDDIPSARKKLKKLIRKMRKMCRTLSVDEGGYYEKDILTAEKIVNAYLEGNNWVLLVSPMQSGKTAIQGIVASILEELLPSLAQILHICGNPQVGIYNQNVDSLSDTPLMPVKSSRLNRIEIAPGQKGFLSFDEVHHAAAWWHRIGRFLRDNHLYTNPHVLVLAVSATAMSAYASGFFRTIWVTDDDLEPQGYNSVRHMLQQNRIHEAKSMFLVNNDGSVTINQNSNAYKALCQCIESRAVYGMGLGRYKKEQQLALEEHLKQKYGPKRVKFVSWNQHNNQFNPEQFMRKRRNGSFTLISVQHMGRMGIRIPTQHLRWAYEYSPKGTIETLAQSLLGRLCGFGKRPHSTQLYTHRAHAEAFVHWSNGRIKEFLESAGSADLKPAVRAKIARKIDSKLVDVGLLKFPDGTPPRVYEPAIRSYVAQKFGPVKISIRTASAHRFSYVSRSFRKWDLDTPASSFAVDHNDGAITAIVLDHYQPPIKWSKTWDGVVVRLIQRQPMSHERVMEPVNCAFAVPD